MSLLSLIFDPCEPRLSDLHPSQGFKTLILFTEVGILTNHWNTCRLVIEKAVLLMLIGVSSCVQCYECIINLEFAEFI